MLIKTSKNRPQAPRERRQAKVVKQFEGTHAREIAIKNRAASKFMQDAKANDMTTTDHYKKMQSMSSDERHSFAKDVVAKKRHARNESLGIKKTYEQTEREVARVTEVAQVKKQGK